MHKQMRIGIVGAGAVGCFYGLALQRAGLNVTFLARGEHLKLMQKHGLLYESAGIQETIMLQATDDMACLSGCNVLIFACKTTQLADCMQQSAGILNADTVLLSMQNGVQAADQLAACFPAHTVLAASAFIGVRIEKAGHVIHSAAGHIRLGAWQQGNGHSDILQILQHAWQKSGIDAKVEGDMQLILWQKMLWNCGFNAVTALTHRYARDVALHEEMAAWVRAAMLEVMAVAHAMGVKLDKGMIEKHMRMTCEAGEVKSSMWQDMACEKATEIAAMNGYIAKQGKQLGIAVPINTMLANMIDLAEGAYLAH